ncbi:MAG: nucleotidyl transferase AbiEii/AbiGii toxin family protein [Bacteroidales bacterium]|nr:nucleotidyl transferase AbiEii/AbiGii toxin family protein [Bacteroidales bacterium]MBN2757790.1 nucleotidyl transferase AbiEii/AbiGii toxin family protein [Bacteroidales bacterium]
MKEFKNFRLAGGTGLSLQLGHRQSIDIDLFSDIEFNVNDFAKIIRKIYTKAEIRTFVFGITFYIKDENKKELKIDVMQTDKFIKPIIIEDNIRFAHIEDIAAMKLEAITSRNTKKDFYDIAELLNKYTLVELLKFYSKKYPYNDIKQVLENITFFSKDCELEFDPTTLKKVDWTTVKFSIIDAFNNYINNQLKT